MAFKDRSVCCRRAGKPRQRCPNRSWFLRRRPFQNRPPTRMTPVNFVYEILQGVSTPDVDLRSGHARLFATLSIIDLEGLLRCQPNRGRREAEAIGWAAERMKGRCRAKPSTYDIRQSGAPSAHRSIGLSFFLPRPPSPRFRVCRPSPRPSREAT
jgi:hypothetical protein